MSDPLSVTKTILNIALTTSPVAVTLPAGVSAETCMIVCTYEDKPVYWRLQQAVNSENSILYPDGHLIRGYRYQPGAVMFFAKTVSGTGTLEIEVLS